jgi:hypothetical protein
MMTEVKTVIPGECHLWTGQSISRDDLLALKTLAVYVDDDHLRRVLKQCDECGQRYYYEFYEVTDWERGNDAQYRTYIPIEEDEETIQALNGMSPEQLLSLYPRLQQDWGSNDPEPKNIAWVGFPEKGKDEEL